MLAFTILLFAVTLCHLGLHVESLSLKPVNRRGFGQRIAVGSTAALLPPFLIISDQEALADDLASLQSTTLKAKNQLEPVPSIIQKEEWDKIRAILVTPPISDYWTKSARETNVMTAIADSVGDAGGDELNILELKEELQSHLRYLDMGAYNNVFNPIKTEGTSGATKQLISSYYDDPPNELKASLAAFDKILEEIATTRK